MKLRIFTAGFSRAIIAFFAIALVLLVAWVSIVSPDQRSEREKVDERVFDAIKKDSHWNLNTRMLYGYYFINKRKAPLIVLSFILYFGGRRIVGISYDEETKVNTLHVERIQIHDVASMATEGIRLKRIALICCFSDYDGWDVGPDLTPTKQSH